MFAIDEVRVWKPLSLPDPGASHAGNILVGLDGKPVNPFGTASLR